MNSIVGFNVSIVAKLPQTTRQRIRGVANYANSQIIFTDTPGIHSSERRFNLHLLNQAKLAMQEADAILYLVDASRRIGEEELAIATLLKEVAKPLFIAINKIDRNKNLCNDYIIFFKKIFPNKEVFLISAKEKLGLDTLTQTLSQAMPLGPLLYPTDIYTDQEPALRISEILRKHAMSCVKEEIPHALYVHVEDLEMKGSRLWARVSLLVERETQKPILIGKKGANIRKIRIESLKELATIFPYKVDLDLQIKVDKDWRTNEARLKQLLT
jgi:GTPase